MATPTHIFSELTLPQIVDRIRACEEELRALRRLRRIRQLEHIAETAREERKGVSPAR